MKGLLNMNVPEIIYKVEYDAMSTMWEVVHYTIDEKTGHRSDRMTVVSVEHKYIAENFIKEMPIDV